MHLASPSSRTACAFQLERRSAWRCDTTRVVIRHEADGRLLEVGARTRTIHPTQSARKTFSSPGAEA